MERTLKTPEPEQAPQATLCRNVMPLQGGFRVIYNTPTGQFVGLVDFLATSPQAMEAIAGDLATEVPKIVRGAPAANSRPI